MAKKKLKQIIIAVMIIVVAMVFLSYLSHTGYVTMVREMMGPRPAAPTPTAELKPNLDITVVDASAPNSPFEDQATIQVTDMNGNVINTQKTITTQGKTHTEMYLQPNRGYMFKVSADGYEDIYYTVGLVSHRLNKKTVQLSKIICCGKDFELLNSHKANVQCSNIVIGAPGTWASDINQQVTGAGINVWLNGVKDYEWIDVGSSVDFHNGKVSVKMVSGRVHPLAQVGFVGTFNVECSC